MVAEVSGVCGPGQGEQTEEGSEGLAWHRAGWKREERVKRQENTVSENVFYHLSYLFVNRSV